MTQQDVIFDYLGTGSKPFQLPENPPQVLVAEFTHSYVFGISDALAHLKAMYPFAANLMDINYICNTVIYDNEERPLPEVLERYYTDFDSENIYNTPPTIDPFYERNERYNWNQYSSDAFTSTLDDFIHESIPNGDKLKNWLYHRTPPIGDQSLINQYLFGLHMIDAYQDFVYRLFQHMEDYALGGIFNFMHSNHLKLLHMHNEWLKNDYAQRRDVPYLVTTFSYRGLVNVPNGLAVHCDLTFRLLR